MSTQQLYSTKPESYFDVARDDFVFKLETGKESAILEVGCGTGATGAAALSAGKAGRYVGIELSPKAAGTARTRISEVIEGNVETMDLAPLKGQFDALIISEVLEHLTDPWRALRELSACLKPGAQVFASSPNISHWSMVRSLVLGRFDYAETGAMDRTHLRWFTPDSYRAMFEQAGIQVVSIDPVTPHASRTRMFNRLTGNRLRHLFMRQIMISGRRAVR